MSDLLAIQPEEVEDFQECFTQIAESLFSEYVLVAGDQQFYLAELEFYLNHENHPDVFTHGDEMQKTCGQWYFHRTGKGYRGGNYKGLDITFSQSGYGGILIRALKAVDSNEYIDGPCKVVDKILSLTESSNIANLIARKDFSENVFEKGIFYLQSCSKRDVEPFTSARFGLRLREKRHISYIMKPYRFLAFPYYIKKGKQHVVLELHHQGRDFNYICRKTACSLGQCEKWVNGYEEGLLNTSPPDEWFNRDLNTRQFSELYGAFRKLA